MAEIQGFSTSRSLGIFGGKFSIEIGKFCAFLCISVTEELWGQTQLPRSRHQRCHDRFLTKVIKVTDLWNNLCRPLRLSQALCYGIHQILWCQQKGRTHIGGELSDLRIKKNNGWKYCDVCCQMAGSTQRSHIRAFGDLPRPPVGHSLPAPQKEQDWHVATCEIAATFKRRDINH